MVSAIGTTGTGFLQNDACSRSLECPVGRLEAALDEIAGLPETRAAPTSLPVIFDRGVPAPGWA